MAYIYISCHLQNMELQITDPLSGWLMVDIRKLSTSIIHRPPNMVPFRFKSC